MKFFTYILLALSLLVSTTGLSVLKHYCGGELAATQVLAAQPDKTEECAGHPQQTDCPHCQEKQHTCHHESSGKKQEQQNSNNCCDNEVEQFKVEDQFVFASNHFKVILNSMALTPVIHKSLNLTHNHHLTTNLNHYLRLKIPDSLNPPELSVFIQSFLI